MKLVRWEKNPVLKPNPSNVWEQVAVFNPAAVCWKGEIHVLYRAVGDYESYVSVLGHAVFSKDLELLRRDDEPCFVPEGGGELSVEDPRITILEGNLYMTYVFTPTPCPPREVRKRLGLATPKRALPRTAVALGKDFCSFQRVGIITPPEVDDRDTVLFPDKINGQYAVLHRPRNWVGSEFGTDRPSIWFAFLSDLSSGNLYDHRLVLKPKQGWEALRMGVGAPPIKTEVGWLILYHAVDEAEVYKAGAAILKLDEPWKVIARTPQPILEPKEPYEIRGDVSNVVFPEGAVVIDDRLFVFYGAADKFCCVASTSLTGLLEYLLTWGVVCG